MKKWLIKSLCLFIPVYITVVLVNYRIDPANIYHSSMVDRILEGLESHSGVEVVGDFDEGDLLERRIATMSDTPETMVMGSSHVLYVDWQFDDYANIGMSGEFLDDYYATIGLLEEYERLPRNIVLAVDPYIFMDEMTIRQDSLSPYAKAEKARVRGENPGEVNSSGKSFDRMKELLSFSYFQASVRALVNGVDSSYTNPVDSTESGEYMKILNNGKRIPALSAFQGADQCRWDAEWYVSNGSIYCMSDYRELSEKKIEEFELLVDYLLEKGVNVELYLPSWFSLYYDEFESNEKFSAVIKSEEYFRNMAEERSVVVHGSYNPYACGITDEDFLDSMHLKPEAAWKNYNCILTTY